MLPVVIGVMPISEPAFVAPWMISSCSHPHIPLPREVRSITSTFQQASNASHVDRDALAERHATSCWKQHTRRDQIGKTSNILDASDIFRKYQNRVCAWKPPSWSLEFTHSGLHILHIHVDGVTARLDGTPSWETELVAVETIWNDPIRCPTFTKKLVALGVYDGLKIQSTTLQTSVKKLVN